MSTEPCDNSIVGSTSVGCVRWKMAAEETGYVVFRSTYPFSFSMLKDKKTPPDYNQWRNLALGEDVSGPIKEDVEQEGCFFDACRDNRNLLSYRDMFTDKNDPIPHCLKEPRSYFERRSIDIGNLEGPLFYKIEQSNSGLTIRG